MPQSVIHRRRPAAPASIAGRGGARGTGGGRGAALGLALLWAAPALASLDPPTTGTLLGLRAPGAEEAAAFEPAADETVVRSRLDHGLCYALRLPREWRVIQRDERALTLREAGSGAALAVAAYAADELEAPAGPDLARRHAADLGRDHEAMLGKPAQAVSLVPVQPTSGAMRWTATWVDAGLPGEAHAVTFESLIVPLAPTWVLELSLTGIAERDVHAALAARVLAGLQVRHGAECGG